MSRGQTLAATLAQRQTSSSRQPTSGEESSGWQWWLGWIGRLPLLVLFTLPAWFKGGVNLAEQQWIAPLLMISLGAWLIQWLTSRATRRASRLPLVVVPVVLGVVLGWIQQIPLAPAWAARLAPQQQRILEEFAAPAGMPLAPPTPATRIGIDIYGGAHQWVLLIDALAALMLAARFFVADGQARCLLSGVALNGAALSLVGILQRTGLDQGWFTLRSEFRGEPFATFVNRNNAAGYLLLCFAAALGLLVWHFQTVASGRRPHLIISREIPVWRRISQILAEFFGQLTGGRLLALSLVLLNGLGVFATLSRGGVVAFFLALLLTTVAFGIRRESPDAAFGVAVLMVAAIAGLAAWLGIGDSLTRRFASLRATSAATDQLRFKNWMDTWPAVGSFGPFGSGLDSYHAVHRLYRQDLETSYFQYAENIFFQTLVEMGWVGLGLLLSAVAMVIWSAIFVSNRGNSPRTIGLGATAMFAVCATAIASCFDFGLYLPANSLLCAGLVGATAFHAHALAQRLRKKYLLRFNVGWTLTPVLWVLVVLLVARGGWQMWGWARLRAAAGPVFFQEDFRSLPLAATHQRIAELEPLCREIPTDWGGLRLAELYIHRFRLERLAELAAATGDAPATLWPGTHLLRFREQLYLDYRIGKERRLQRWLHLPPVRENLWPAWKILMQARTQLPLNSKIQLLLAQLQPTLGDLHDEIGCARTLATAPTNAGYHFVVGGMHLQAGRIPLACRTWRRCLELDAFEYYDRVIGWIHPLGSTRWAIPLPQVVDEILPEAPRWLVRFASQYLGPPADPALRTRALQRAAELLAAQPAQADGEWVWLDARVKRDLGNTEAAIEQYRWLKKLQPENMAARYELARILTDIGEYEAAEAEVSWLIRHDSGAAERYLPLKEALSRKLKNNEPD